MNRLAVVMALLVSACAADASDAPIGADDDEEVVAADPIAMPKPILGFLKTNGWGTHHLEWHTIRNWDRLQASDQAYAKRQGWARADKQEGSKGNGLEFLAMHRAMFHILLDKFPENKDLFAGWPAPPTNAKDRSDPVPSGNPAEFDPAKLPALDKLANHLADFKSDDELGLYIETTVRPTASNPNARATDPSAGIHNFIHNRFSGDSAKVDIGDPSVNLQNKRFWRLHGWIESRWTEFRRIKNLSENDPAYLAAIKKGTDMLQPGLKGIPGGAPYEAPPASLRKFFAQDP